MVNAVALPALDGGAPQRAQMRWREHVSPLLLLLPPAILLGILRVWSLGVAPKLGVYFSAEALLTVYACFAVARAVYVNAHGRDALSFDPQRAQQAKRTFYAGLRRHWAGIALIVLPLLLVALAIDALTAHTGVQLRPNVHLSMMFIELMAWWRYGSAIVMASAQWAPPHRPPALARARCLAGNPRLSVARSMAPAHLALCAAALSGLAVYGGRAGAWVLGPPIDARVVLGYSAALCAGFAWMALWGMCRGSLAVLARVRDRAKARREVRNASTAVMARHSRSPARSSDDLVLHGDTAAHDELEPDPIGLVLDAEARFRPQLAPPALMNALEARSSLVAGPDQHEHALK
jgi:hypothetical protein